MAKIIKSSINVPDYKMVKVYLTGLKQAAGSSVMANISEGFARRSNKEFTQFLFIAMSSSAEVQSHLYIALNQGYINQAQFDETYNQATKTAKIVFGLITYLRNNEKLFTQKKQEKQNKPNKPEKL